MRRRAERILGGHVRVESDNESDNDSGDDDDQQVLGAKMNLLSLSPSANQSDGSRRMMNSLAVRKKEDPSLKAEDDVEEEESVFSFLSEWK